MTKYIDVTTDFGFKRVFGSENSIPILKHFLFSVLDLPAKIVELEFMEHEHLADLPDHRKVIFDVACVDENGRHFIVEMQKRSQFNFADRMLFYSTFPIRKQAERGDWNFKLTPVYCVGILDFSLFRKDDRYFRRSQILDLETHEITSDKLVFVFIELSKLEIARSMLAQGIAIETITTITGLTTDQIRDDN